MVHKEIALPGVYTDIREMLLQLHIVLLQSCYSWSRIVFSTAVPATGLNPLMCYSEWGSLIHSDLEPEFFSVEKGENYVHMFP